MVVLRLHDSMLNNTTFTNCFTPIIDILLYYKYVVVTSQIHSTYVTWDELQGQADNDLNFCHNVRPVYCETTFAPTKDSFQSCQFNHYII